MERLDSLDGVFLAAEDPDHPMNIGSLAIFAGPAPPIAEVRRLVAARIDEVPRCRRRIREPTGPVGRPVWIDDTRFDLTRHVRRTELPTGEPDALEALTAAVLAEPLDRTRPLWALRVVYGLPDGRWAIIAVVHHCLVDGIAGSDLLGALLSTEPGFAPSRNPPWAPAPEPTGLEYARFGLWSGLGSLIGRLRGAARVLGHPLRSWRRARATGAAAKRLWYRQHRVTTSLTGPIGNRRRWARAAIDLGEVTEIRTALGGTVNDVVVAAVALALRDLLAARGESVFDRTVTAMIPVSVRTPTERGRPGNRVANVHAALPMGIAEPRAMLDAVHDVIENLKGSHEADATGLLLHIGDYVPRFLADRVVRTVLRRQRSVETVITDVPGPTVPLFLGPHRMLEGYPIAPIAGRVRICVALWSYVGTLAVGVTGDHATAPDVGFLADRIRGRVAELLDEARSDHP